MIFKGLYFRHNRLLVALPDRDETGAVPSYADPEKAAGAYVWFGRATKNAAAPGAVKTAYRWPDETPLYAVPVPLSGHSRTNMAYGTKGQVYLMHGGACFQARSR